VFKTIEALKSKKPYYFMILLALLYQLYAMKLQDTKKETLDSIHLESTAITHEKIDEKRTFTF
jgi:hypothetical protein